MEAWNGIGNDAAYNHTQTPRGASAHGAVSQQEGPAVLPSEVRENLLRRNDALRPLPPRVGGREKGKVRNAETELTGKKKNRIINVQQPKKGRKP